MSKKIVILGAGYAGLRALHELQKESAGMEITLVDRNDYHYEATDLHEVAAGTQKSHRISYPVSDVIKDSCTTFIKGTVSGINTESQQVQLADGMTLPYDYLVVALGFESESFGIPGVEEYSLQMVDVATAEKIHQHIEEQMKLYKQTKDENALKIVVCGAGFTGIELLGALVEGKKKFAETAGVKPDQIKLYCVEAVTRLLPMFSEKLSDYGIGKLKEWGVEFLTGKPIKEIKDGAIVYLEDKENSKLEELQAATIIWTTGVSGSHVIGASGFEAKRGRVMVNSDLTSPGLNNVYIVGDCSAVMDEANKRPYATTAQISLKMGERAGKNIKAQIKGKPTQAFTFHSLGSVCSIGNTHAFGEVGKAEIKGYPASFVKKAIMDRSLFETGGVKEALAKGRFDFYH